MNAACMYASTNRTQSTVIWFMRPSPLDEKVTLIGSVVLFEIQRDRTKHLASGIRRLISD